MRIAQISSTLAVLAGTLLAGLLTGCSSSFVPDPVQPDQIPVGTIQGVIHGGQAPVLGAKIYMYAASTSGYAGAATSLLNSSGTNVQFDGTNYYVQSDYITGSFTVTGDYTCTAGTQVYLVGVGGNSGTNFKNVTNPAIVQMAALGQCPTSGGSMASVTPYVTMNEISTVVMAYALGGFGTDAFHIGSNTVTSTGTTDALAQTAIANAFANIPNILNVATGQPYATTKANANGAVPSARMISLGNILATCVNTQSASSTGCLKLFQYATSDGTSSGTQPTDESGAIFNIVHNTASSYLHTNLYGLIPSTPVFSGGLGANPTDWTLPIIYTSSFTYPFNFAFDANGNGWVGDESAGLFKISPAGVFTAVGSGYNELKGVAVASNGDVWATDYGANDVYVYDSSTATPTLLKTLTGGAFSTNGLNGPEAVSFDLKGNAYVANAAGTNVTVSKFGPAGGYKSTITVASVEEPAWIVTDNDSNTWVPSQSNNYYGEIASGATTSTQTTRAQAYTVALDKNSNAWLPGIDNNLYHLDATGAQVASYAGGSGNMYRPYTAVVDGNGTLWMSNPNATVVSAFSTTSLKWVTANGFQTGATGNTYAAAPDLSGNLWTASSNGQVTELLGIAAPTAAPMVPPNLGVEP